MVGLVVRKSARGLLDYFDKDFNSSMWVDQDGKKIVHPRVGGLLPGKASVEAWQNLEDGAFRDAVQEIDCQRKDRGILALELGFGPPKSVSIAGLADEEVSLAVISTHRRAVDDALAILSPSLLARAGGGLIPCGVRLMEFAHPWNRSAQPQLHSHVVILRDFSYSHALWTTPVFLLQRTLREIYHYALCSRLVRQGFRVAIDQPGNLAWELTGVPPNLLKVFSERSRFLKEFAMQSPRGYFSQGAEFRVASWVSRRQLPKTDPSVSLADARQRWRKGFPHMELPGRSPGTEVGPVALEHVFRLFSVVTRQQFIGAHLRWWLGNPLPLNEAVALAGTILDSYVDRGSILQSGQAYCWPERLDTESAILKEITASFGSGPKLGLPGKSSLRKSALTVLSGANGVKIVSSDGLPPPKEQDLRTEKGTRFNGTVKMFKQWNPPEVLCEIENRGEKPLVILVEEPFSVGDFSSQADRVLRTGSREVLNPDTQFWIGGRKTVVRQGDLERKESGGRFAGVKRWLSSVLSIGSTDESDPGVILAPWLDPDHLREENWRRLHALSGGGGQQIEICRPLPWARLNEGLWEGLGIFCHRNTILPVKKVSDLVLRTIRHGAAWFFTGPADSGMIPVVGVERKMLLPLAALNVVIEKNTHHLLLVERMSVSVRPGIPLASSVRFEEDHQVFPPNQVFVVERIGPSGRIHFRGGSHWPNDRLVMEPAFLVREFPPKQPELPAILVQAEWGRNGVDQISALPRAGVTIISSKDPTGLCAKLDRELGHRETSRRLTINHQVREWELPTGLEPLFPATSIWLELRKNLIFPDPVPPPVKTRRKLVSPPETVELAPRGPDPIVPRREPEKTVSTEPISPEAVIPPTIPEVQAEPSVPKSSKKKKDKQQGEKEERPSELK